MKKLLTGIFTKNFLGALVVIFIGVLAARTLIFQPGYFLMHDDLQMMRQLEMEKCFLDGQIPCRWVPDMGYGFGFPLFNFYPPLPYLVGEAIRLFGFSFAATAKINFALSLIVSGITMYLLAKEFFGRLGGVVSSAFYIWAPYHAVEIYVRGAMNENWALVFFPLIFLASYMLVRENRGKLRWMIILALSWFGLLTSHNLMVMIFTPFFAAWVILLLLLYKNYKVLPHLVFSGIWSFGLAAFFTLPALVENGYTHVREQLGGYFEYSAHFVTIKQLFVSRFWGYGGSAWGVDNDGMSFSIGHIHWILITLLGLVIFVKLTLIFRRTVKLNSFFAKLRQHPLLFIVLFLVASGWGAAFMTHNRSTFIYKMFAFFQFVQFPWRFLTLVIFMFSFALGAISLIFRSKNKVINFVGIPFRLIVLTVLIAFIILFNWNFFLPKGGRMGPLSDGEKFSGVAWELQSAAGAWDYLPITAKTVPESFRSTVADASSGQAKISNSQIGTSWLSFDADVESDAVIRLNQYAFPEWKVFLNQKQVSYFIPESEKWGRMYIRLLPGRYNVAAKFENTPIRRAGNVISLISWGLLVLLLIFVNKKHLPKVIIDR